MSLKFLSWLSLFIQQRWPALKKWLPRTESWVLFIGLACTVMGKVITIQRQSPPYFYAELVRVLFPDVLFFTFVFLTIYCFYIIKPSIFMARIALLIAALVSTWSALNMVWLAESGVQLQPGILKLLLRDLRKLWPLVQPYLRSSAVTAGLLGLIAIVGFAYFLWRFLRPVKVNTIRNYHAYRGIGVFLAITAMLSARPMLPPNPNSSLACKTLNFSSHWHALRSTITGFSTDRYMPVQTRNIARAGQRKIRIPEYPPNHLPNVVLVLLGSIPYSVTSLADPAIGTTPNLARLARQGTEFRITRAPVPYTTKAFWVAL